MDPEPRRNYDPAYYDDGGQQQYHQEPQNSFEQQQQQPEDPYYYNGGDPSQQQQQQQQYTDQRQHVDDHPLADAEGEQHQQNGTSFGNGDAAAANDLYVNKQNGADGSDPYIEFNGRPYSDDPDGPPRDMAEGEEGAAPQEEKKKSTKSRIKKYCAGCYTPTCDFRGPCKFPHGCCYSFMGIMSGAGGLMTNCYVLGTCIFQRVHEVNTVTGDPIPGQERGYGFLSREADYGVPPDYGRCTWYTSAEYDSYFDGWMKTGRFFAFVSAILACACFLVLLCTCCCAFSPSMFERWLMWMYIGAAITVALSMFIFGSENCTANDCTVADGCGHAITAFMFHLISANTVKSFNPPSAPPSRRNEADDVDEELDDLYYEDEDDKYPPPRPEGPRGVTIMENGERVYDEGEDYYDDMGRMIDPNDEKGAYQQTKQADVDDDDDLGSLNSADLDDISDGDLSEYASDNEDDDDNDDGKPKAKNVEYDEFGNPVFDPDSAEEHGNLGVGYENADQEPQYDEFGNPIEPQPQQQYDEFGNPIESQPQQQYDEFGNPIESQSQQQHDEFGNPYPQTYNEQQQYEQPYDSQQPPTVDEFGNPLPPQEQQQYDEFGNPLPAADPYAQDAEAGGYRQRDDPPDDDGGPAFA